MTLRPSAKVSGPGRRDGRDAASAMSPPATAAATNSMPTNSRPLPRKTVAKKRSSRPPIRSRSTPMNQRKAIPANGTRFSAIVTAVRCADWVSHEPAAAELAGTETLSSTSDEMRSTEKTIPATAAARGVLRGLPACSAPWPNGPSVTGLPLLGRLAGRPRPLSALGRRGSSRGVRPFHDRALSAGRRHGPPRCRTNGARQP